MWTCFIACIQFLLFNLLCEPGALDSSTPILPILPCHHPGIVLFHVTVLDQLYLVGCVSVSCFRKINHPSKVLDLPVTYRKFQGHVPRAPWIRGTVGTWAQHVKMTTFCSASDFPIGRFRQPLCMISWNEITHRDTTMYILCPF